MFTFQRRLLYKIWNVLIKVHFMGSTEKPRVYNIEWFLKITISNNKDILGIVIDALNHLEHPVEGL